MSSDSVVILIAGGHCSGKQTVCNHIRDTLERSSNTGHADVHILNLSRYKNSNVEDKLDPSAVIKDIENLLKEGPGKVILIPGLYALYDKRLRSKATIKIFLDSDSDTRLMRWVKRDVVNGESELKPLLEEYLTRARPEFNEFILPTKQYADVILPRDTDGRGISLICDAIEPLLDHRASTLSGRQCLYPRYDGLELYSDKFNTQKDRFYDLA